MKRRTFLKGTGVTIVLNFLLVWQNCLASEVPQHKVHADPLTRIADDVIRQTVFDLPATKTDAQPTRYNLWMYQNFMLLEGMDALGEVTGNKEYKKYASRNIDFFAAWQSKLGDSMTAGPKRYSKPSEMWHCGMIAAFAERQRIRPNPEFVKGMATFDALLEKAPAFEDGVLVRRKSQGRGLGLQIDDLFMITPYWCRKAELLNEPKWLDRAIEESLHYFDYLWDKDDKLMHCLWLEKNKAPYGLYWGRGNGWYIMAVTDLLTFIPQDHPKRKEVLEDYRTFINGIIRRQGKRGLWHQILDRPDTYAETSCSGMFTYCILKGVNEGWLDSSFLEAGTKGWRGLLTLVNDEGEITRVCPGSDISENPNYYLKTKAPKTHDQHGIGPFLLAGAAYLQANKTLKAPDKSAQNTRASEVPHHEFDVCVYGGTASGVMAALAAEKEGANVILIEPSRWLGGMTGGGINHLDWGKGSTVGGSTYKLLMQGVQVQEQKHHGGHARQGIGNKAYRERFKKIVEDRGITVIYEHRLGTVKVGGTTIDSPTRKKPIAMNESFEENKAGQSIRSITLDYAPFDKTGCPIPEPKKRNAITVSAKVFIDCSYEGDVLAMSGASYTWGRESREKYGESLAGVRPNLWVHDIDPYVEPGNPESGLLPFVQDRKIGALGSADDLTMGYCFRYEFDMSGKGIPVPEPANYDPAEFEVYRRAIRDGVDIFSSRKMRTTLNKITVAKRGPFVGGAQSNRNLMGSTVYGCNDDYPNGDWATRSRIWKFHQEFLINSIHFAKTDPSAPKSMKQGAMKTSFRKGVFDETGGWPNQFYVRQARRMVSSYVVTQKDLEGKTDPPHTVALAAYGVDDWPYAVVVQDGKIAVQGGAFSIIYLDNGKYNGSYKIPYEAIVPRKGQCDNLLVPVCVSASHIAFTSLRMEPVWMVLGESAGVAAAMAVDAEIPVQDVPYNKLRQKLDDLDQTLDRIQGPVKDQKKPGNSASWKSQDEWNKQKKGWEWLFPHIDTDSDGQISAEEYKSFQKYRAEHKDWGKSLREKRALTPEKKVERTTTGLLPRDKPNIVLIFADDVGIEALNAYGGHGVRTPHLDKLATGGMLFTHCFANPACSPSRAEIMTGTYPGFAGIKHVLAQWKDDSYLDPKQFNSFANQLKKAGYATAIAGKWNLSWLARNDTVKAFGFDEYCLWQMYDRHGAKRSRYYKPHFRIDGRIEQESIAEQFGPDVLTDFMIDFMKRKKDEPFLVYYPALLVHTPYIRVPGGPKTNELPDSKQKNGPECFPEMVEYLDKNVGRLVNAVDELGISNNTIVIFCADNGTHGPVTSTWGEDSTRIKGGKMTMTDRGSRVPLIVSWPETIKPAAQCDDLVELADFLPTFLEIASAPKPVQRVHGQSFLTRLLGKEEPSREWVHIEYKGNRQIRTREWIYTSNGKLTRVNELGRPENGPEEQGNHADVRNEMKSIFASIDGVVPERSSQSEK